jgi:hypothetical protein
VKPLSFKRCFAVGCQTIIPRHLLMCRDHWFSVPENIREQVAHAWARFEHGGKETLRPYVLATLRAQLAVADREGKREHAEAIRAMVTRMEQKEAGTTQ